MKLLVPIEYMICWNDIVENEKDEYYVKNFW